MQAAEKILIGQLKEGNESAYRFLYNDYYTPLFHYALKFVEEEIARDFVQEIFYRLWNQRNTIEINTSLNAYLFKMIRNQSLQYFEKEKSKKKFEDSFKQQVCLEELCYYNSENGIRSLIEKEVEQQFQEALNKLPEKCLQVFRMSRFDGKKNHEIADELGVSIKAVEKQMSKALKILRAEMKDYLPFIIFFLS
ncbi:MAG: RNA polymerase sigma-70 factor [Bacteroidota bacterium]|nr:RNA polymerase sigma-70 factor [Bacteroidota bacterium]